MKKLLTAALVASVLVTPAVASAAPTVSKAAATVQSGIVEVDLYSSKYVSVYQYYSKFIYPDQFSVPFSYYYTDWEGYSGSLYRGSVWDLGSQWSVTYTGYVYKY